jgi:hypothetical protein
MQAYCSIGPQLYLDLSGLSVRGGRQWVALLRTLDCYWEEMRCSRNVCHLSDTQPTSANSSLMTLWC